MSRGIRWALLAGGWLAVALGTVGIVVPGLPTTGFFVLAASLFARSSPRFERWVLGLPRIGPMVADHRAGLGMPRRAKVYAIGAMWAAIAVSAGIAIDAAAVRLAVVALGIVGAWYIVARIPTRERVLAARGAGSGGAGSSGPDPAGAPGGADGVGGPARPGSPPG